MTPQVQNPTAAFVDAEHFEQQTLAASRSVLDAFAGHQLRVGRAVLAALDAGDLDEIRFIANDLIGYGEHTSHGRFNNAIGNHGDEEATCRGSL